MILCMPMLISSWNSLGSIFIYKENKSFFKFLANLEDKHLTWTTLFLQEWRLFMKVSQSVIQIELLMASKSSLTTQIHKLSNLQVFIENPQQQLEAYGLILVLPNYCLNVTQTTVRRLSGTLQTLVFTSAKRSIGDLYTSINNHY